MRAAPLAGAYPSAAYTSATHHQRETPALAAALVVCACAAAAAQCITTIAGRDSSPYFTSDSSIFGVAPSGVVFLVAGSSSCAAESSGDGGLATQACLRTPQGIAVDSDGNILTADLNDGCVRKVWISNGTITTVAGGGSCTSGVGDGGPATLACIAGPVDVAVDRNGSVLIADTSGNRIRKVAPNGTITTLAGGTACTGAFHGDGGPATLACLYGPQGVATDAGGNVYFSDSPRVNGTDYSFVRKIWASSGRITTIAGGGTCGNGNVDGGAATGACLSSPGGLVVDASGDVVFTDDRASLSAGSPLRRVPSPPSPEVATAPAATMADPPRWRVQAS